MAAGNRKSSRFFEKSNFFRSKIQFFSKIFFVQNPSKNPKIGSEMAYYVPKVLKIIILFGGSFWASWLCASQRLKCLETWLQFPNLKMPLLLRRRRKAVEVASTTQPQWLIWVIFWMIVVEAQLLWSFVSCTSTGKVRTTPVYPGNCQRKTRVIQFSSSFLVDFRGSIGIDDNIEDSL